MHRYLLLVYPSVLSDLSLYKSSKNSIKASTCILYHPQPGLSNRLWLKPNTKMSNTFYCLKCINQIRLRPLIDDLFFRSLMYAVTSIIFYFMSTFCNIIKANIHTSAILNRTN